MAQVQVGKRERAEELDTKLVIQTVNDLSTIVRAGNVLSAPTTEQQAANITNLYQIIQFVSGPKPPEKEAAKRQAYVAAIQALGKQEGAAEGSKDIAVKALQDALSGAIFNLYQMVLKAQEAEQELGIGKGAREVLDRTLAAIHAGFKEGKAEFAPYAQNAEVIPDIRVALVGAKTTTEVGKKETVVTAQPIKRIELLTHDLGPVRLLSGTKENTAVTINGDASPLLVAELNGSRTLAQDVVNDMANCYATLTNFPNNASKYKESATALYESLNQIPKDNEIWGNTDFTQAMAMLQNGNLADGLKKLSDASSALAGLYTSMSNLYVVSVSQRAVSVARAGVVNRFVFEDNNKAWAEFVAAARNKEKGEELKFDPHPLWVSLAFNYEQLLLSGQLTQLKPKMATDADGNLVVQRDASGNVIFERAVAAAEGRGDVFSIRPQMAFGLNSWGSPVEMIVHCDLNWQKWALSKEIEMADGTKQKLELKGPAKDQQVSIGLWGVEFRPLAMETFPGKGGNKSGVRLAVDRIGGGMVGLANPLGYITLSGTWMENSRLRLQSYITPQYSYFLEQHRIGAEILPLDLSIQFHKDWVIYGSPKLTYEYNFGNRSHTWEIAGTTSIRFGQQLPFDLNLTGGFLTEQGAEPGRGAPQTGTFAATLTIPASRIFDVWGGAVKARKERKLKDLTPKRE